MTARTYCVRWLMILLTLNLAWVRPVPIDPIPVPAPVPVVICDGVALGDVLGVQLAARQQAVYELLGWGNYDVCQDMFLLVDEDVYGGDPEHVFTGSRDEFTPFSFTVSDYVGFSDWESYGLSQSTIDDICAANAVGGVFIGTINSTVEVAALTISTDDPLGVLPRTHAILIVDGQQAPRAPGEPCDCQTQDPDGLRRCCEEASNNLNACLARAGNNYDNCLRNNVGLGACIGGLIGCVIGALEKGGVAGAAAIKAILILCGIGLVAGAIIALLQCYSTRCNDTANCQVDFQRDKSNCLIQYCDG